MTTKWQIFNSLEEIQIKNSNIDSLLGYPNEETKTETYRDTIKHPTEDLWRGGVGNDLIEACLGMTSEERLNYYDGPNLKDYSYLENNGWFVDN